MDCYHYKEHYIDHIADGADNYKRCMEEWYIKNKEFKLIDMLGYKVSKTTPYYPYSYKEKKSNDVYLYWLKKINKGR
jgi:hypothetical protein